MKGRKPKPTAKKKLTGNPGRRPINAREPKPPSGAPAMPELDDEGQRIWSQLAEQLQQMGVLTVADGAALELLSDAISEWRAARKIIRESGATYTAFTEHGEIIRSRPEVAQAADAMKRIRSLITEFGLTPSSRSRIQLPGEEGRDEFEEFLRAAAPSKN